MDIAELDRARALERKFSRRAARTRRSKWLGRLLFSLTGMGLLLLLRLNPEMAMQLAMATQGVKGEPDSASLSAPESPYVRNMPNDFVPVRRGGNLPGNGARVPEHDAQSQADAINTQLRGLDPTR